MTIVEPIRVVIAGGGTGGHVLPALAVVEEFERRKVPARFLWIGSRTGVEGPEAQSHGIEFRSVSTGKFRRYPDFKTIVDAIRVPVGVPQAWRILREFKPDVIFSTGGYVSTPSVIGGARIAPVLSHEQTAILGLATRINLRFVEVLALSFDSSANGAATNVRKVVVTGNPVRRSLKEGSADRGRAAFSFTDQLPVLYITGGARGATPMNERVEAMLPDLLAETQILHQTGTVSDNPDFERLTGRRRLLPESLQIRYQVRDRIHDEMADVYAMADLVLGRAGAGTVAELAYLGIPSVLIPLPGSGGGEQERNAISLASVDGAVVISQDDATPEQLKQILLDLIHDPARRKKMGANAARSGRPDSAERLAVELLTLAEAHRSRRIARSGQS